METKNVCRGSYFPTLDRRTSSVFFAFFLTTYRNSYVRTFEVDSWRHYFQKGSRRKYSDLFIFRTVHIFNKLVLKIATAVDNV